MDQAAVIDLLDRDGQVRASHKVQHWPLRIGRSPRCDLVLDDPHVAEEHAELVWDEQGLGLNLMPSVNGAWLGRRHLNAPLREDLPDGQVLQLGLTRLRVRSTRSALAPELPMDRPEHTRSAWRHLTAPGLILLWMFLLWIDHWLGVDPGSPWVDYASAVLVPVMVLLAWAAVWALVTQLFHRWFAFMPHLRRSLIVLVSLHLLGMGLPVFGYALSMPRIMVLDALVFPIGLAAMLWWQAGLVWPRARRGLALGLGSLLVVGFGLSIGKRWEQQHWFGPAYLSALPPPALRLVQPKPTEALIDSLKPLEAQLRKQAAQDNEKPSQDGMGE